MSYQVIARKWRPQTFDDLVGQQHVTETLKNAIKNDRVAHAYIFSGARGVGKTTAARILAKALNCVKGPTSNPCAKCDSCKQIAAGTSLDVIEIDAASNRGIDQIRELREMVRYAPAASRSKVVILDEAHMLTGEASNALLKTLEEPPDRVIFVMATTQPEDLVDTIRSRSQHFHFRALTFAEIAGRLEEIAQKENLKIEPGAMAVIARMAEGSLRDALSLLEQARAYCGDTIPDKEVRELLGVVPDDALEELVQAIAEGSADRALGLVHTFQREGRNLQHFCREATRHMRNLLIARTCGAETHSRSQFARARGATAATAAADASTTVPTSAEGRAEKEETITTANTNGATAEAIGISQENGAEIKTMIQAQQKFLGELVEQSNRWELEGAELCLYFSSEKRPFAELLEGRESLEKIRIISSKVLGRAGRVCAKLATV